ncbi:hypothetical protein T12_1381 [Trichinella patagoniensis]|uniref:Uncharacterized protein n=1 Tax=Trichinella patagoniensis TaxID=990121 RepID=A0A0V0X2D9_9BILA|nr:hypothetical protein T12_1381 [Trichinella patagoniensis]
MKRTVDKSFQETNKLSQPLLQQSVNITQIIFSKENTAAEK